MFDDCKFNSLHIMLPKPCAYLKSYAGQAKYLYFLAKDDFLKKYNTIWDKARI